ncbi:MAG: Crp/Fnr family transcriptional regulator [Alphaproteobacteria bacterium]|nr:Crp/Fnr family transcriptional regulator [Alphaproteobacteria bacterium]
MDKLNKTSVDCLKCRARNNGLCSDLSPEQLARVRQLKSCDRVVRAGADIFIPGEPCCTIYNVTEGWAFRYGLLKDGRRQILDFALPGAVLGFHPAQGTMVSYGAQALTDTVVCVIPRENFATLCRDLPEIGLRLAMMVSRDRSLAFDHLVSVGRQLAVERVTHLILELFLRARAQWPGQHGDEMQLPLTQEHIADATGLTPVHVNRVLRELSDDGVITFRYRRLCVLDPDKLAELAEIDPHLAMSWTRCVSVAAVP